MATATLPVALRPVGGVDLTRIGPERDGGYVVAVASLAPTTWLLGLGLGDDWRFEADFQQRTGVDLTVYDHTVTSRYWQKRTAARALRTLSGDRRRADSLIVWDASYRAYRQFFADPSRTHVQQQVGHGHDGTVALRTILAERPGVPTFLKMDIEGWEWRVTSDLVAAQDRLTGMAIEFHDVDLHLPRLVDLVEQLDQFAVVNLAANNFAAVAPDGVPHVVEISFARRDQIGAAGDQLWQPRGLANWSGKPPITVDFR